MRLLDHDRQWQTLIADYAAENFDQWPDTLVGDAALSRGHAHFFTKDGASAERDLQQAAEWLTDQNSKGEALLILGGTYRQLLKDDAKAIAAYRHVYDTTNEFKHCTAAIAIAEILRLQNKRAEALTELNRIDESKMTIPAYRDLLLKAKESVSPSTK